MISNGIDMAVWHEGEPGAPLVVMLHGFPELGWSWRHQVRALAEAGFYAVAPDQRGYGATSRQGPYDLATLSRDVAELITGLGYQDAIVVGHDWGAAVAWEVAGRHRERVRALVTSNAPPASVLGRELVRNFAQLRRSSYMFFFQIPLLPEWMLSRNDASEIARALVGGSRNRSAFSAEDLAVYQDAFSDRAAVAAALGWYRAALRRPDRAVLNRPEPITAATLVLWGADDPFLGKELVAPERLASVMAPGNTPSVVWLEGCGHFVQNEAPDAYNDALVGWLREQNLNP